MLATLKWFGCATFRLDVAGMRVMLDAYTRRAAGAEGPTIAADDLADIDWILVGHSHFDHLWGAAEIAQRTGATIVGSYETVRLMRDHGVPRGQLLNVSGGETVDLGDGVHAAVYPSLHSASWAQAVEPSAHETVFGDLGVTLQERRARERTRSQILESVDDAGREHLRQAFELRARGDGGALIYLITTAEGSLLYQDTAGCWTSILRSLSPDVAILSCAGRGNADGQPWQGALADFVAMETRLLGASTVIPCHHDNWLPGFSTPSDPAVVSAALDHAGLDARVQAMDYESTYRVFPG